MDEKHLSELRERCIEEAKYMRMSPILQKLLLDCAESLTDHINLVLYIEKHKGVKTNG